MPLILIGRVGPYGDRNNHYKFLETGIKAFWTEIDGWIF